MYLTKFKHDQILFIIQEVYNKPEFVCKVSANKSYKFDKRGIERFLLAKNSSRTFRLQLLPSSARIKNANVLSNFLRAINLFHKSNWLFNLLFSVSMLVRIQKNV